MGQRVDLKKRVKTLDGEKEYIFCALVRKPAAEVFHGVLTSVVSAIAGISASSKDAKADAVFNALRTLDFETTWSLAEKLLQFSILDGVEINDLNDTDYFDENPEELYIAIFHASLLNFPDLLLRLRGAMGGSSLPDFLKGLSRKMSGTVSVPDKPSQ